MASAEFHLPKSVKRCQVEGKDIFLVGTAHVSQESVDDVRETIQQVKPDAVCVELCEPRRTALVEDENWKKMDIVAIIRKGKAPFLLCQLILSSFYKRLGEKLGVKPGAEMLEAIQQADAIGAHVVLADREVEITLKRVWGHLSFWSKFKMLFHLMGSFFIEDEIDEKMVNDLKNDGQLESAMKQFAEAFPQTKERLIDERDVYLAQKIRSTEGQKIIAVVGAGHVNGILDHIQKENELSPLRIIPEPSRTGKLLKWLIPALIVVLFAVGFMIGGKNEGIESLYIWVVSHSALAAAGALLSFSHPLTVLAAAAVAPFTSLNPLVAAGWIAGMVQAFLKRPTVKDLEDLPTDIGSLSGFWRNPATRVLLTVILVNLGSSAATFISGSWIVSKLVSGS